jgi:hypothetical protein
MPLGFLVFMDGERNPLVWIVFVLALAIWELFMSCFVFGSLNEKGLANLRWRKWKQVSWVEMTYGGAAPNGFIRIKLSSKPVWSRYLLLRLPNRPLDYQSPYPADRRFLEVLTPPSGRTN